MLLKSSAIVEGDFQKKTEQSNEKLTAASSLHSEFEGFSYRV